MENLPIYIYLVFCFTVVLAVTLFYKATRYSSPFLVLVLCWILLQSIVAITGFYKISHTMPPRIAVLLVPPVILIIVLFSTARGRVFIDGLDIKALSIFHIIRIPVEIVLFWLSMHKAIPQLMTFEGRNFDILSGLAAPLVYYLGFVQKKLGRSVLLGWNIICLALLLNIVVNALLSVPTAFQQFAFEQPNIAILYFPFVLLPAVLVPLVLFAHLVSIRQLRKM